MSVNTAQLEADIARTRQEMAGDLAALGDRVSPKKAVVRTKAKVADKITDKKEEIRDRVSPVRVIKRKANNVRSSVREKLDDTHAPSLPSGDDAKVVGRRALDATGSMAGSIKGRARELARKVESSAGETASSVKGRLEKSARTLSTASSRRPLRSAARCSRHRLPPDWWPSVVLWLSPPSSRPASPSARPRGK